MRRKIYRLSSIAIALFSISAFASEPGKSSDTDWPQWRGPNRDGISTGTGLIKTWPESGPDILWKNRVGTGFSGMSVAESKLVTMFAKRGEEFVFCYNADTGEELWSFRSDSAFYSQFGHGPRSTPTIDGETVFTLGANGKMYAVKLASGEIVWQRDLRTEFGSRIPQHGIATSPLIENDLLLVNVGGVDGQAFMAFNKSNGEVVWASHLDNPDYSAPIAVTVDGVRQIIFLTNSALYSVSPQDGEIFWDFPWVPQFYNANTPIFIPDNMVFISTGHGKGSALLQVTNQNGKPTVSQVAESKVMRNDFSSSVVNGGYIYGFDEATLKCVDVNFEEEKWAKRGFQKGTLILADGQLIVLSERGKLALIDANPNEYVEHATAQVLRGRCWTVPTLSNGKLYVRNQKEMVAIAMTK